MIHVEINEWFNRFTSMLKIVNKTLLTGGDYAGEHPGRCDGWRCVGSDGIRDLCLRRPGIVGRRAVDVISAKLVIRHRLVIIIRVTAGAGTWRRVFATTIRVPIADKWCVCVNRLLPRVTQYRFDIVRWYSYLSLYHNNDSYIKLFYFFDKL